MAQERQATVKAATSAEVVKDRRRFLALKSAWDELAEVCGSPLASHDWFLAALDAKTSALDLHAILLWQGERLIAAAPLGLERKGLARRLVPIDAFAGEPGDFLYKDEAALLQLASLVAGERRSLLLRSLPARGPTSAALADAFRGRAPVFRPIRRTCAFVDLGESFAELELRMSGNRRSAIRRKQKAAVAALGPWWIELVTPEPNKVEAALDRFMRIEGSGWKGADRTSIAADPRMGRFIRKLAWRFAATGQLRLIFMGFGTRELACRMMLEKQGAWFEIKIGFDETYAQFSPGILLMHETLRAACEAGVSRYEFLGTYESWQDHWPRQLREYERFAAYWPSVSGIGVAINDALEALRGRLGRKRHQIAAKLARGAS